MAEVSARDEALQSLELGKAYYYEDRYDRAAHELQRSVALNPDLTEARLLLGIVQAKMGRLQLGEENLDAVLKEAPNSCDALLWMAFIRKSQGNWLGALALCERMTSLQPSDASGQNMLGLCLLHLRRPDEAVRAFRRAVELAPKSAPTFQNLGLALRQSEKMEEAAAAFRQAVALAPGEQSNYYELYRQLELLAAWDEAARYLEAGARAHPNSVILILALANVYAKLRRTREAEETFKRAVELDPSSSQSYGLWLQFEGRFEESVQVLERSIELRPLQGLGYFGLAEANRFEVQGERLIEKMVPLLSRPEIDPESRMYLCYALGKAYDHAAEYRRAMQFFDEGNALAYQIYNAARGFDIEITTKYPEKVASIYSRNRAVEVRSAGSDSAKPLFIVGMIRSGTTLLDQILTSHPSVEAAGELDFWKLKADQYNRIWFKNGIDAEALPQIEEQYLRVLDRISKNASRVTDKMPINFESVGMIHTVFPEARILHIRRNPLDTCLSIHMTFYGGGPNFAYKKENIIAYFRAYMRFMELWREIIPSSRLLEIDYEDLVAKPEPLIRQIIEFCGLPWDSACLDHQGNRNTVATPSTWQARQPIYKTSVERWRRYEPWLGDLAELKGLRHPPGKSGWQ